MPHRSRLRTVASLLLAGAVVSGCGGDSPPSTDEYRGLARATCQAAERRVAEQGGGESVAAAVRVARTTYDAAARALLARPAPPAFDDFVRASGRVRTALRRLDGVVSRGDAALAQREASALHDEASALASVADAAGLAACGGPAERGADALLVPFYEPYVTMALEQWERDMRRAARGPGGNAAGLRLRLAQYEQATTSLDKNLAEAPVPEALRERHDAFVGAASEVFEVAFEATRPGQPLARRRLAALVRVAEREAGAARRQRDRLVDALVRER